MTCNAVLPRAEMAIRMSGFKQNVVFANPLEDVSIEFYFVINRI
jgi:hypothetical protein